MTSNPAKIADQLDRLGLIFAIGTSIIAVGTALLGSFGGGGAVALLFAVPYVLAAWVSRFILLALASIVMSLGVLASVHVSRDASRIPPPPQPR